MGDIKLVDLQRQYGVMKKKIDEAIKRVVDAQKFISGEEVAEFEEEFAGYCESKYAVGVSSGSTALLMALKALGCGPGDEVIVPSFTFVATGLAVDWCGARTVFCDVDRETGLMDPVDLKKRLTKKTKFIVPVHLYGQVAPMKEIMELAKSVGARVIEDAAQAHGAKYRGKKTPISNMATFSFFPSKNLGGYGDSGIIVTRTKSAYEGLIQFRNHGRRRSNKYKHYSQGFNFRMDELQAAVLRVKLNELDKWNKRRRELVSLYKKELAGINEVKPMVVRPECESVFYVMVIRAKKRDQLKEFLGKNGVASEIHFPIPLHLQPVYRHLGYKKGDLPVSERLGKEVLSLPLFAELTEEEVKRVAGLVKRFYEGN